MLGDLLAKRTQKEERRQKWLHDLELKRNAAPRHWGCRDEQDTVVLRIHSLNEETGKKKKKMSIEVIPYFRNLLCTGH